MLLPIFFNLKFYIMKLLFGSIIVKGAGRINGHVVRNYRGMPLLTRLALPTRSSAFNSNPQLNVSTLAFKYWSTLNSELQKLWSDIAAEIPFKDRWGNTKYLSGRDFVSFLYINTSYISQSVPNPNVFVSSIPSFVCTSIDIDTDQGFFNVNGFSQEDGDRQVIYMKQGINDIRLYNEKQLKFIINADLTDSAEDLYIYLTQAGINFSVGQTWHIGIKNVSNSGMTSPMQIFTTTIPV